MYKNFEIPALLGEQNTVQANRLPVGALVSSQNIDVTNAGAAVVRSGFTKAKSLVDADWIASHQDLTVYTANGNLYRLHADLTESLLKSSVSTPVAEIEIGGRIFTNSGLIISPDDTVIELQIPVPAEASVSVISGELPAGIYQVACTCISADGRESGLGEVIKLELPDNSGLSITTNNALTTRIYATNTDGITFFYITDNTAVITQWSSLYAYRLNDSQRNAYPFPAIETIGFYNSRLYGSVYDTDNKLSFVFFSKPHFPHLCDIEKDFFVLQGQVTSLVGIGEGLVICSTKEINLFSDDAGLINLARYGTPFGNIALRTPDNKALLWTNRGLCIAVPFQNLTESNVSVKPGDQACLSLVEQNGISRAVVVTDGGGVAYNALF